MTKHRYRINLYPAGLAITVELTVDPKDPNNHFVVVQYNAYDGEGWRELDPGAVDVYGHIHWVPNTTDIGSRST